MTRERLYYDDSYLTTFAAPVTGMDPERQRIRLDRSAFYPTSGGQPHDTGSIAGIAVTEVVECESGEVVHVLASPLPEGVDGEVECRIDRDRRFDHMQQHTGQHLLSAVLAEVASAPTVSFHMGAEVSTVELGVPALDPKVLEEAERRCNELIAANRPVTVSYQDADTVRDLRKPSERQGSLRIVTIEGIDKSACGGTHVRSTGEIGCILLRGTERLRRNVRLEFVCGLRAVRRSRADYNALTAISRTLTSAIDDTPKLVASLAGRAAEAEKQRARLALEIVAARGREMWRNTEPGPKGLRVLVVQAPVIDGETRAEAQAFTAEGGAVALIWCSDPPSVLISCSADSGLHAGNLLKAALAARGGRGGGSAQLAQGGLPEDAAGVLRDLEQAIRQS